MTNWKAQGWCAWVTGGASGIGYAVAEASLQGDLTLGETPVKRSYFLRTTGKEGLRIRKEMER
jgi:hypothetical protein